MLHESGTCAKLLAPGEDLPRDRYVRNGLEYPSLAALLRAIEAEHAYKET